jgi:hypothetical protein
MSKFIDVNVKLNVQPLARATRRQIRQIEALPARATEYFKAQTPIKTGNARRNTSLKDGDTIHADYAYAQRLDEGWSQKSPLGMTKPTERWVRDQFKKIFKK